MGRQATATRSTAAAVLIPGTLKLAILKSGISQRVIARKLRISVFRLSRIVRERQDPTDDERDRLADILGVSARTLFP